MTVHQFVIPGPPADAEGNSLPLREGSPTNPNLQIGHHTATRRMTSTLGIRTPATNSETSINRLGKCFAAAKNYTKRLILA